MSSSYIYFQWLAHICEEASNIKDVYRRLPSLTSKSRNAVPTWPRFITFKDFQRLLLALSAKVDQMVSDDLKDVWPLISSTPVPDIAGEFDSTVTYDAAIVASVLSFYGAHTSRRLIDASNVNRGQMIGTDTQYVGRRHTRARRTGST